MTSESPWGPAPYNPMGDSFQQELYEIYDWLRSESPIHHDPVRDIWAVARFSDAEAVLLDPQSFSSRTPSVPEPAGHLAVQDPPRHTELRRLVSKAFTPRRLRELGDVAATISHELMEVCASSHEFDVVSDFAVELPGRVFAHMMGIPPDQVATFQELIADYVDEIARVLPGQLPDDAPRQRVHEAIAALVEQRRADPQSDLLTRLLEAEVNGQRLTDAEVEGFCFNLILAANETTANLLANGVATLYQHPEQADALRARGDLVAGAIEEILRFESPVQALHRTVVDETELNGVTIPEGSHLMVLYGSANRDPEVFRDPGRFDIYREGQKHLAFGRGIHFCLGASLARLEAEAGFRELLAVMPQYEPAESDLAWKRSPWQRSLSRLPLREV